MVAACAFRLPDRWSILLSLRFGGENTCRSYGRLLAGVKYGEDRLRYQPIPRVEVFSSISNELRVGWMADSLYARDHFCELGVVQGAYPCGIASQTSACAAHVQRRSERRYHCYRQIHQFWVVIEHLLSAC